MAAFASRLSRAETGKGKLENGRNGRRLGPSVSFWSVYSTVKAAWERRTPKGFALSPVGDAAGCRVVPFGGRLLLLDAAVSRWK